MNRTIKFRARWKDTGKIIPDFNDEYIISACNDPMLIVEQYTEMKDINGNEIYEGDIVKCVNIAYEEIKVVKWKNGNFVFHSTDGKFKNPSMERGKEVIGNIHGNPELMEQQ